MTDLSPRPETRASSSLATLHSLCRDEYRGNAPRRRLDHVDAGVRVVTDDTPERAPGEPSDLAVAIRLAQLTLSSTATADHGDPTTMAQAHGSLTEALRILLRALDAETAVQR
ncbi:hypothetical protein [Streptomyces europaeiscabiei]|uniref:hypothetical protein n=1 Tax=Streptomyces europaeiscabiei TaxID=146819 RepID=UPI0029BC6C9D|nr:hypothetical protein [Streptomyces europaeiscabiei]MDX3839026.1 hypothetical protein [Streptomyces europaeiscabiei]